MLQKTTRLEAIQIGEDGELMLRFKKTATVDGAPVEISGDTGWHRTMVPPGTDPDVQMAAVNANLTDMGYTPPAAGDMTLIRNIASSVHTTEVRAAYRAKMEALDEANNDPPVR